MHHNVIFSAMPRRPNWSPPLRFSGKHFAAFLVSLMHSTSLYVLTLLIYLSVYGLFNDAVRLASIASNNRMISEY
jgi:hypothetical protein